MWAKSLKLESPASSLVPPPAGLKKPCWVRANQPPPPNSPSRVQKPPHGVHSFLPPSHFFWEPKALEGSVWSAASKRLQPFDTQTRLNLCLWTPSLALAIYFFSGCSSRNSLQKKVFIIMARKKLWAPTPTTNSSTDIMQCLLPSLLLR